jgi:acetyl esterase
MSAEDEPWKRPGALALHPALMAEVEARRGRPPLSSSEPAAARERFHRMHAVEVPVPAGLNIADSLIPARNGPLRARFYLHEGGARDLALFFHGGGFVQGDIDTHHRIALRLAVALGANVVSVGYGLGPEHPFPAAVHDAIDASCYVMAHAVEFGGTAERVLITGDSAGGTLALVAAMELSAGASIPPLGVLALYPVVDFSRVGETASYRRNGDAGTGLSTDDMMWFRTHYAPDPAMWTDWRCSPIFAQVRGPLPSITIAVGAHDVLFSENAAFAARLAAQGVDTKLIVLPDANHGFMLPEKLVPSVVDFIANLPKTLAH